MDKKKSFENKLADIVNMAGFPMAVIDIHKDSEIAFCTEKVAEFFQVELPGWKDNCISKKVLTEVLTPCKETLYPEFNEPNVFRYVMEDGSRSWISIKVKETDTQFLCVLMDVSESIRERRLMRRDRDFDVLTRLYTRRALQRKMESLLGERNMKKGIFSVWDLDNLKYINDHYGHEMGDKYICMLSNVFRAYKNADKIASRLGGDEFVVVLYGDEKEVLLKKLQELHDEFINSELELPDGTSIFGSVSVGVSIFNQDKNDYEELFRRADDAMYDMKRNSKGKIRIAE